VIRLGFATTTNDRQGAPLDEPYQGPLPSRDVVDAALDRFRGTFLQQPPAYSAKMIDGHRSYKLARRQTSEPALPAPAAVTTRLVELRDTTGDLVMLHVVCSTGFYVRSLAHDLGEALGTGAHLVDLRRTRSGDFALDAAHPLDDIDRHPDQAGRAVIPLGRM